MANDIRWDDLADQSAATWHGLTLKVNLRPGGIWSGFLSGREVHFPADTTGRAQAKMWLEQAAERKLGA